MQRFRSGHQLKNYILNLERCRYSDNYICSVLDLVEEQQPDVVREYFELEEEE
jgi:hypothetical protein